MISEKYVRPTVLRFRVKHIAGPSRIDYGEDEALAICIVRNGEAHVRAFIDYHFKIGIKHIVLLDNGSTDRTLDIARRYNNLTILHTKCKYSNYENVMKRYLARRFSSNRWNLCVDIDERFDYPGSDIICLREVLRYLNRHSYTAVVSHMLDMFPDCQLNELDKIHAPLPDDAHIYYDTSNIRKTDYVWGTLSNQDVRMYWNGIRNTIFGTEQGLTKAALVFVTDENDLFVDWHHAPSARLADFTALLRHYPFAGFFHSKVQDAIETNRYGIFSVQDYGKFWQTLTARPETHFRQASSRRWRGTEALIEEGFLVISRNYRQWLDGRQRERRLPEASIEV